MCAYILTKGKVFEIFFPLVYVINVASYVLIKKSVVSFDRTDGFVSVWCNELMIYS